MSHAADTAMSLETTLDPKRRMHVKPASYNKLMLAPRICVEPSVNPDFLAEL